MSTEIRGSLTPTRRLRIDPSAGALLHTSVYVDVQGEGVHVSRADFLTAVAAECDVLVIDKATLPEVDAREWLSAGEAALDPGEARLGSEYPRTRALAYLALAEYIDAHPPVDETQVEALAGLLDAELVYTADRDTRDRARRLYAAGVRIEVTP